MRFPLKHAPLPENPHVRNKIRRVEHEVTRLSKMNLPYVFGGGRTCGYPPCADGPGDCSWFQGHLINVAGFKMPVPATNLSTFSMEQFPDLDPDTFGHGPGKFLTFYIKDGNGDPHEAHTFCEIRGRFAECGGTDNPSSGNGPSWFHPGDGMGLTLHQRLQEFPNRIHIRGL